MESKQMIFVGILVVAFSILVFSLFSNTQSENADVANRDLTINANNDSSQDETSDEVMDIDSSADEMNDSGSDDNTTAVASAEHGRQLYQSSGCMGCHTVDGSPGLGPSFLGLWGSETTFADGTTRVVDADYIYQSIRDPGSQVVEDFNNVMMTFSEGQLSDADINDIIAYIQTLTE